MDNCAPRAISPCDTHWSGAAVKWTLGVDNHQRSWARFIRKPHRLICGCGCARREVPRFELTRCGQIDIDREMTFIAPPQHVASETAAIDIECDRAVHVTHMYRCIAACAPPAHERHMR
jgi:hypothetical protein